MRILDKMLTKIDYTNENIKLSYRCLKGEKNKCLVVIVDTAVEHEGEGGAEVRRREWESGAMVAHKALHTHAISGTKGQFGFRSGAVK